MAIEGRSCGKLFILTILFVTITCVVPQRNNPSSQSSNPQTYEKQMLDRLINNNEQYDSLVRPTVHNTSEPIDVHIHVIVRSLEFMDMLKNEYTVNMLIFQEWEDSRLSYAQHHPPKKLRYLTVLDTSTIWKPDLYFLNEKLIGSDKQSSSFARIAPTGKVSLVLRVIATLVCPVDIRLFPFDSQKCPFKMASAAFSREDVTLKWKNPSSPIEVYPNFALMPGVVYHSVTDETSDIQTEAGVYSCLSGEFEFNRLKGYYWKQLFIPSISLVAIGWFSFFLDGTGIPGIARAVLVGVNWTVGFLKISNFYHDDDMRKVSYSTSFDVWLVICLVFIFAALLLSIISIYMANHGHTKVIPFERLQAMEARKQRLGEISALYAKHKQHRPACMTSSFVIDRILIFAYPILFAAFALAYFTVCLKLARSKM